MPLFSNPIPMGIPKRSPMALSAQHDEVITYIHEAWHKVSNFFFYFFVLNF